MRDVDKLRRQKPCPMQDCEKNWDYFALRKVSQLEGQEGDVVLSLPIRWAVLGKWVVPEDKNQQNKVSGRQSSAQIIIVHTVQRYDDMSS